tara:strand:+ start:1425 stop:2834 length:1410 start_codon:yes stop_codon:yes gene_type:complete
MKFLFGIWTMAVALTVSAVAAYYSIIGLTAIFASAVIPVIIMGATLEVAKVTSAVWLHSFWDSAPFLTKAYLTCAVVILMFITSMGIFGFLSKAHIEQSANSGGMTAQIERVDQEILRQQQTATRATATIDSFGERVADADVNIQGRIEAQERLIADVTTRLAADIATQNQLIAQSNNILTPLKDELDRIASQRQELSAAQQSNDVARQQLIVGTTVDGQTGPATRRAITTFTTRLDSRQTEIIDDLARLQTTDDPLVITSRAEIVRLNHAANAEISRTQDAINSFRNQLITVTTADNTDAISASELIIDTANDAIGVLLTQKFTLENKLRLLEVEVGPVKYIAELVYGETNAEVLEQSVRWVIIIIVLVFDPLAVVLVLAGLSILHREPVDNKPEILHTGDTSDVGSPEIDPIAPTTAIAPSEVLSPTPADNTGTDTPTTADRPALYPTQGKIIINGRNTSDRNPNEK